ncbi:MAG: DUF4097 domain-containing protein [Prevotellaceae bacterium]|jgi:hypothetical protein|nr:DUF4097 domain-containing protein [Prevotellaceae bacterium]
MKIKWIAALSLILSKTLTCCGMVLANEQRIGLSDINSIAISYQGESITLHKSNTDSLIIKEYMKWDNSDYYARVAKDGSKLTIMQGERPFLKYIWMWRARVEVYIPTLNTKTITVKTTSGSIVADDEYTCSHVSMESSSGSISINTIAATTASIKATSGSINSKKIVGDAVIQTSSGIISCDIVDGNASAKSSSGSIRFETVAGAANIRTSSGSISLGAVGGNVSAEASSGSIELKKGNGNIRVKTSSGRIDCAASENAEDISLTSSSGSIYLNIPRKSQFNFTSKTTSGHLSTPFSDKLFSPVTDNNVTQGAIGGDNPKNNVNIRTTSGSIKVKWIESGYEK